MKKWFIFIVCLWASQASAQGTYTATSCSLSAISAAIAAEQAHPADGDIISIPAGNCTWTGSSALQATFTNSITIQGAGAISATDGGASTTGSDVTVILDHLNRPGTTITFTTTAGKTFRVTGIEFLTDTSTIAANNGILNIAGASTSVRIDHNHFFFFKNLVGLEPTGPLQGVADHNVFESNTGFVDNPIAIHNGISWNGSSESGNAKGDHSWNDTEHWGSSQFFFFEDNRWINGDIGDGSDASRYVLRHNTIASATGQMYWHGQTGARGRGTRAAEVYQNVYSRTSSGGTTQSVNSGTLLYWGNTSTNYTNMMVLDYTRKSNGTYNYGTPPGGWGNCNGAGTSDGWDSSSTGPCFSQPGRGRGELLSGDFPNVCNITLNPACNVFTGQWPREDVSPIYVWNNTFNSGSSIVADNIPALIADNREYYQQFDPTFGEPGSFDGTKGVGQGLLSARPSTCTAGPGGNTPGVGYWATDTNTLYVCNPSNTWTVYYTPYTYPHPLTQSSLGTAPPTNLAIAVQ